MNRLIIKISNLFFVLFLLYSGAVSGQPDTLSFLHITDLHVILNQGIYPPDFIASRKLKQYDQGETRLRQFLGIVPGKTNSQMVIATGDLIDFYETNTSDGQVLDIQSTQFSRLLDDYHTPILLALGNHDVFSYHWDSILYHNQNSSGQARASWIRNVPCFQYGTSYSEKFRVGQTSYRFIFLDDSFYQFLPEDTTRLPYVDKSQIYWLNNQLKESGSDVVIVFMHIPFNLKDTRPESLNELYSSLTGCPSVKMIFSGHYHRNEIEQIQTGGSKIVQVQTGSLVQGTDNWRLVRLTEGNILVSTPGGAGYELTVPVK